MRSNQYIRGGILAAAIACATTLSACAGLGPDYTRPNVPMP